MSSKKLRQKQKIKFPTYKPNWQPYSHRKSSYSKFMAKKIVCAKILSSKWRRETLRWEKLIRRSRDLRISLSKFKMSRTSLWLKSRKLSRALSIGKDRSSWLSGSSLRRRIGATLKLKIWPIRCTYKRMKLERRTKISMICHSKSEILNLNFKRCSTFGNPWKKLVMKLKIVAARLLRQAMGYKGLSNNSSCLKVKISRSKETLRY